MYSSHQPQRDNVSLAFEVFRRTIEDSNTKLKRKIDEEERHTSVFELMEEFQKTQAVTPRHQPGI